MLVVIRGQSREKEQHWTSLSDERRVVAGSIAAGGILEMKWELDLLLIEKVLERSARSRSADKNFFILDPTDHVHVNHGDGFVERKRRLLHPFGRAKQAQFFPGKIRKKDAALELAFPGSKQARKFENAGGAGSVVVGARMYLTDL